MADDISLSIRPDVDFQPTFFIVELKITNRKMMGKKAEFTIDLASHGPQLVNDAKRIYTHNFTVDRTEYDLKIPTDSFDCFTYNGTHFSITLRANLKVDDAWILKDSEVSRMAPLKLVGDRTGGERDARKVILGRATLRLYDPFDKFQLSKNFNALPAGRKLACVLLSLFCVIALVWGSIAIWKLADDGVVLGITALIIVVCGLWVWFINKLLKSYMKVALQQMPTITRNTRLQISQLISGKSEVDLKNVTLRVVACNLEKGVYEGSGPPNNSPRESFEKPVRPIILYSEKVSRVPAGQQIGDPFPGEVDFGPMFKALYPPLEISKHHGLAVYWEVQLLHDEFRNHILKRPSDRFEVTDFFIA